MEWFPALSLEDLVSIWLGSSECDLVSKPGYTPGTWFQTWFSAPVAPALSP